VLRCGWYTFNDKNFFIDPRRKCSITNKNISIVVDSFSQFPNFLRRKGKLEDWKKIYLLAKKFPVARIIIKTGLLVPPMMSTILLSSLTRNKSLIPNSKNNSTPLFMRLPMESKKVKSPRLQLFRRKSVK